LEGKQSPFGVNHQPNNMIESQNGGDGHQYAYNQQNDAQLDMREIYLNL